MRFSFCLKKTLSLLSLLALAFWVDLAAQGSQQLYLITGLATPKSPFKVATTVLRVDEVRNSATAVAVLNDAKKGSEFILVDHERQFVAVGSPHLNPTEAVILNMNDPGMPRTVSVSIPGTLIEPALLSLAGRLVLGFRTFDGTQFHLTGVELSNGLNPQDGIALEDYRFVRREGWWAPGDEYAGDLQLAIKDGKIFSNIGGRMIDLEIRPPEALTAEPNPKLLLLASNDELLVIDRPVERAKGPPGPLGRTQLWLYNKKAQTWRSETFNGSGSSIRVFGSWIAVNEGEIKRDLSGPVVQREPNETESPGRASVATPKPAIHGHLKTGHMKRRPGQRFSTLSEFTKARKVSFLA